MKEDLRDFNALSTITRRGVLGGIAGAGAYLATAGLPGWGASPARAADIESELVFAGPGGASQQVLEEMLIPDFKKMYGDINVTLITGQPADNVAKLRTQAASPTIDAIWLAGGTTYQAIDAGLVAPLDASLVPNLAQVPANAGREAAAAPIGIAVVQLMYSIPVFQKNGWAPPSSWFDLWDTRFKGHVGLPSINISSAAGFLALLAKQLGGDEKNVDPAFAKLKELRPQMLNFYSSLGNMETALQQGDLWIGNLTAHRGYQLKTAGTPIGMSQSKEGGIGYQTWVSVVKGAPHRKAAHAWVNYLLSPEGQQKVREGFGYTPVISSVPIPEEDRIYFPDLKSVFIPDWRYIAANLPKYVERWNREVER
ncbi:MULTISPECIES: extracellular solute-binding protein [unclassified Sinorhizobium]|uniref:extracellular solute-binding protein n=1 Tax=unclassified Sinorhizobium TaxID=2613772 RepID=UPI003524BC06